MAGRYEILDILAQDKSGVVFHAEERETGRSVVLRRFFPFGPEGGGLQEAERAVYQTALDRVRDIHHPTLRRITDGGCDPVDGMPFLVTEWVEGQRLGELLKSRALSPGSTRALLTHALEASKAISEAFGEEAVWVETTPDAIILPVDGEVITFWISPLEWLASPDKRAGLLPLAKLAERALHMRGKPVAGTSEGLGSWIKAVRENPRRWTLDQALQALHEPLTMTGPPTAVPGGGGGSGGVPTVAMRSPQRNQTPAALPKKSLMPLLLGILFILLAGGGAAAYYYFYVIKPSGGKLALKIGDQKDDAKSEQKSALDFGSGAMGNAGAGATPAPKPGDPPPSALPPATPGGALAKAPDKAPTPAPAPPPAPKPVLTANPANQLAGQVIKVDESDKGGVVRRYITIKGESGNRWAVYDVALKKTGFELGELNSLIGRQVRMTGTFRDDGGSRGQVLLVTDSKHIEVQQ